MTLDGSGPTGLKLGMPLLALRQFLFRAAYEIGIIAYPSIRQFCLSTHLIREGSLDNRTRYLQLLEAYGITQAKSAELIAAVSGRPCAVRTVRSWVNDPTAKSSSPCPDWAVSNLEKAIHYMERAVARREEAIAQAKSG